MNESIWLVVVAYAVSAASLLLSLFLFLALKREIAGRDAALLRRVRQELAEHSAALPPPLPPPPPLAAVPSFDSSLAPPDWKAVNVTRRSQMLRLARRGDTPAQIAAALEAPLSEVVLTLKISRMLVTTA